MRGPWRIMTGSAELPRPRIKNTALELVCICPE